MNLPEAHKALFVALLGMSLGCGDPAGEPTHVARAQAHVVGGWAARDEQIFATVEIRRAGGWSGFCSGTLIAPSLVVTAAHCAVVEPEVGVVEPAPAGSLWVVAGHLASREATDPMIRVVAQARVHPQYDHDFIMGRSRAGAGQGGIGSPNDIAVLLLASAYDHNAIAPLLTAEREERLVRHGDVGFVAGYGVYDLEAEAAGELYISDAVIDIIGKQELLTRRSDQLGDSCYGDSGGPLYVPTEEGDFLVGLVSRGRSDVRRDCGDGGVYTLISAHLSWIAEAAGESFRPRWEPEDDVPSFLEEGAEPIRAPKGGSLRRTGSCAASHRPADGHEPFGAMALLVGIAAVSRRLSHR